MTDLSALAVTGNDAAIFLQGQTTCDVNTDKLGAFCNAKGRVISTFVLLKNENGFLLILPTSLLSTIQERLQRYKLRAKVEMIETDLPAFNLPKNMPWLSPETSEQFIPQWLNLDTLGGISFTKGCYTGQEIVARTHYLGDVKRRLFLARCETDLDIVPNCSIINESGATVGNVLTAQNGLVQCVLQVEAQNSSVRLNRPTQEILVLGDCYE
jgi:folate-binding protein YgfZ